MPTRRRELAPLLTGTPGLRGARLVAATVLVVALAIMAFLATPWSSNAVRREMVALLESRFGAEVSIGSASVRLLPRVSIEVEGLEMERPWRDERLPVVRIHRLSAGGTPWGLLRRYVDWVHVEGLDLQVARGAEGRPTGDLDHPKDVTIGTISVRSGLLHILPDEPGKLPLRFSLAEVDLKEFRFDHASEFRARLTNPKPAGIIMSQGRFGPWDAADPKQTAVQGDYLFRDARLSTFKGIAGVLTSTGRYTGVLGRIGVRGTTTTPDFRLDLAGQPVALSTSFDAVVDGTSGDTILREVRATLGRSVLEATGSVASEPGADGRTVRLQVRVERGQLEDFVRLAVRADQPFITADLDLETSLVLPPGDVDVPERLELDGRFEVTAGQFTAEAVQNKVDELSRRGQGQPGDEDTRDVISAFGGTFSMRQGAVRLPGVRFAVTGATVEIAGSYSLPDRALDFQGDLRLDATLSRSMSGFKSWLLRPFDPLFSRDGAGAVLPIRVGGTIDDPRFGIDTLRALTPIGDDDA